MPDLVVEGIERRLGGNEVLRGVALTVKAGEVVALLGPSGSGKTTLLRAVAGLERPDAGRIALGERVFFDAARGVDVAPEHRGLALVFQSYALWPHRSVHDNVAYGLRLRKRPAAEVARRVEEALARLGLAGLGARFPHELSGGQQQRVALARAIVYEPPVLLLDEPLSNLDAKLREEARAWLRTLIVQLGLGGLYVTHDQTEAMAVSDRILLLQEGRIEQAGSPQHIYEEPSSARVADFMGSNNKLEGRLVPVEGGGARLEGEGYGLWGRLRGAARDGAACRGIIRIEHTALADGPGENRIEMRVEACLYLGERWEYLLARGPLRVRVWGRAAIAPGEARYVAFPAERLWLF